MRTNTIIALGVSAAFGVGAVVLARVWVKSAVEAEVASAPRPAVASKQIETVSVLVAAHDIARGQRLSPDMLREVDWPAEAAPQGYFQDARALFVDPSRPPVALINLSANEPVLPAKFSGPGGRATLSVDIAEGMRAFTIKTDEIDGVAGFILPGDMVDVMLVRREDSDQGAGDTVSDVLLQNVRVLAVDQLASVMASEPRVVGAATLEVTVEQAQKLALAYEAGRLALMLRRAGSGEPYAARTLLLSQLTGEAPKAAPRRADAPAAAPLEAPAAAKPLGPHVLVRRGVASDRVSVVRDSQTTGG